MKQPFIFDSNSMRVIANYYPEHFPTFWKQFAKAVDEGHVKSVREVYNELELTVTDQEIWKWVKERKAMFYSPTSDETNFVAEIFKGPHFQALVGRQQTLKGRPVADPFIVASARCCGGCVVTEELLKKNAAKIPNVCDHFGVACTNVQGFLKENGWVF